MENEEDREPPDTIELVEHGDVTPAYDLSSETLDALEECNRGSERIRVRYTRDGYVRLQATQYLGTVGLPGGTKVRIEPKASGTTFLWLLTYAYGVDAHTVERETTATPGATFVDAIGALFAAECQTVIDRALHKEYRRVDATEERLRGQLDIQRQLQRQGRHATAFEVTYDELTTDTVANRGLHQAAGQLASLVSDTGLARTLERQRLTLERAVTPTPVRPSAVAAVETTRMNAHYETALDLAEQVLRASYLQDLQRDESLTFGLLLNMNQVYEKAVERAAQEAIADVEGWDAVGQARRQSIVSGGNPTITLKPDVVVREKGEVQLVIDAKWKTGQVRQSDVYQLTSYQLADEVPGLLIYPEQGDSVETSYKVNGPAEPIPLVSRELPTASEADGYEEYVTGLRDALDAEIRELCSI